MSISHFSMLSMITGLCLNACNLFMKFKVLYCFLMVEMYTDMCGYAYCIATRVSQVCMELKSYQKYLQICTSTFIVNLSVILKIVLSLYELQCVQLFALRFQLKCIVVHVCSKNSVCLSIGTIVQVCAKTFLSLSIGTIIQICIKIMLSLRTGNITCYMHYDLLEFKCTKLTEIKLYSCALFCTYFRMELCCESILTKANFDTISRAMNK